jgi:hypothetical protein
MEKTYCGKTAMTADAVIKDTLERTGIDWSQPNTEEQDEWALTPMGVFAIVDGSVEYLEKGK